jgi:molybdopterin-binding protein
VLERQSSKIDRLQQPPAHCCRPYAFNFSDCPPTLGSPHADRPRGGVVDKVIPGAVNAEVKLTLAGGRVLTAIVTLDALNELKLSPGSPCTALIKASHVLVAVND